MVERKGKKKEEKKQTKRTADSCRPNAQLRPPQLRTSAFAFVNCLQFVPEGAELLTAEPLGGGVHAVALEVHGGPEGREEVAREEHASSDDTQSLDDDVSVDVLCVLGERRVDDVAEVGLHADVQEAEERQNLVHRRVADRRVDVVGDEHVLNNEEEEEEEDRKKDKQRK